MADKVVGIKIDVQDSGRLSQLEQNLVKLGQRRRELNKLVREGTTLTDREAKELGELGTQAQATRNKINDLKNGILKQNDALKKNSGFVAGIRKGIGQWATSMIGITAAIAGVTKLVGDAVRIITDFEKANSKLQAVLGATNDEMKIMSDQAKELGASTAFTASQVTELQTEFAKLGFPVEDIQNMTESTLNAAAALGSELGEQAALSGAVLKQYGLDSSEAARVNDVLAKSASSSALDFQKLATALPIVGATANTAGVSLERTTALLGTLSDRGLDASSAGTALRNIFLELSKQGLTFEEAMLQINNATDKNAVAMDLFGKRGATAGVILAETGVSVGELEAKLIDAEGAAQQMADTMLDNLSGDITKAQSAWEGFILSLEDGEGVLSQVARSITQEFSHVLGVLTKINEGKFASTGLLALEKAGVDTTKSLDGLGLSYEQIAKATDNNSVLLDLMSERLRNGEITIEKYRKGVELLANGWKRASKDIREGQEEIAAADTVIEESTELTDKEKEAIRKKAELRAAEKKAAEQRTEDVENIESKGLSDDDLTAIGEGEDLKNELLIEKQKEFNEMTLDEKMAFLAEQARITKEALNTEIKEDAAAQEMKKAARMDFLRTAASVFSGLAGLAKKGSDEFKALALADIAANTAIGFVQALNIAQKSASATGPAAAFAFPIFYASQIAAVLGAASQAKSVLSTKAARGMLLEDGGMINGNSHANGGVPFSVDGQLGFEAEGGEAIINKKSTQMFRPLLSAINEAGGGVSFAKGGKIKKFQNGGIPNNLSVSSAQQGFLQRQLNLEEFSSTIIEGINNKQVINVASNTSDVATEVFNTQSEATF